MCEWCEKYSDGYERWYFNPANYARRLYKIRKEEAEALGAEANPQDAGGMAFVGQDYLQARERGDVATMEQIKQQVESASWVTHFGQVLTLEEAIRKMTSFPAQRFRLMDRGVLRPGNWGDVVVFDLERIRDRATNLYPHTYPFENYPHGYPEGIDYVFVNGVLVVQEEAHTGALPGKILRHPSRRSGK